MISYGFWNSRCTYCVILFLDLLNWYFASMYLAVVPKTVTKSSTLILKFLIDDMCDFWLKCSNHPPRLWWPPLSPRLSRPFPYPMLLLFDSPVASWIRLGAGLPPPLLLPLAGGPFLFPEFPYFFIINVELSILSLFIMRLNSMGFCVNWQGSGVDKSYKNVFIVRLFTNNGHPLPE